MSKTKKLTPMMQLFVLEHIKDFKAGPAARRAGYSAKTADQAAYQMLKDPRIKEAIDVALKERKERLHIDADNVLWMWWQIANADYNELSSVRRVACGYCYGDNVTLDDDDSDGREIDPSREPNPDCGICRGEGSPHVHIADTSKLSPAAKLLYQGAKETKFGIEIQTADRMKALDNVARHLGMFKDTVNHVSEDGSMTPPQPLTPESAKAISKDLDDEY
ncbi:terminase small subunit [uncultured Psychrobacter sp.]|uniref:terminase small subunit n=1 Tax=uncultured Psychrobacter sp. TaxID=259303 RepID=UPI00262BD0FC|nr:terminase small subunit [uncultured Psychrobacter sp.]